MILGVLVGAGLVFGTLYATGSFSSRTVTETVTTTSILTITPSGVFVGTAQVQASVTSCTAAAGPSAPETCELVLTNSGNASVAVTASCSLTFGGHTYSGTTSAQPTIPAGGSASLNCVGPNAAGAFATPGIQVTGAVILANGGNALFSATAS